MKPTDKEYLHIHTEVNGFFLEILPQPKKSIPRERIRFLLQLIRNKKSDQYEYNVCTFHHHNLYSTTCQYLVKIYALNLHCDCNVITKIIIFVNEEKKRTIDNKRFCYFQ